MKKLLLGAICLCVIAFFAAVFLTGCDEAEGLELIVITPSSTEMTTRDSTVWLTATLPGSTTTTTSDETNGTSEVSFGDSVSEADSLHLPLEWEVANASLGQILGSGGLSALYVRSSSLGENTITVRDQYDNEGFATIRQLVEQYRLDLVAVSGTLSNNSSVAYIPVGEVTATIRVNGSIGGDGPTAPFTWTTLFPTRGYIQAGQGTDTVVYRTTSETETGYNVVQCTDFYGVTGTIVVEIGEEDSESALSDAIDTTLDLAASPNPIPNGQNQTTIGIVSAGTPPYSWSATPEDVGNGYIITWSPDTTIATLQTDGDGDYQVSVTDSAAPTRSGQITVTQE